MHSCKQRCRVQRRRPLQHQAFRCARLLTICPFVWIDFFGAASFLSGGGDPQCTSLQIHSLDGMFFIYMVPGVQQARLAALEKTNRDLGWQVAMLTKSSTSPNGRAPRSTTLGRSPEEETPGMASKCFSHGNHINILLVMCSLLCQQHLVWVGKCRLALTQL